MMHYIKSHGIVMHLITLHAIRDGANYSVVMKIDDFDAIKFKKMKFVTK